MENIYVCDYCGEFVAANGNKEFPSDKVKCNVCGCTNFKYFIGAKDFKPPYSQKLMQLRFGNLVNEWEEHRQHGITPSSGETPIPKCPTCGSTNIKRISALERGTNAAIFGLYGNKRRYQFECLNPSCGYKW